MSIDENSTENEQQKKSNLPAIIATVSIGLSFIILLLTIRYLWNAGAPKSK